MKKLLILIFIAFILIQNTLVQNAPISDSMNNQKGRLLQEVTMNFSNKGGIKTSDKNGDYTNDITHGYNGYSWMYF